MTEETKRALLCDPVSFCKSRGIYLLDTDLPPSALGVYYRLTRAQVILLNNRLAPVPAASVLDRVLELHRKFPLEPYFIFTAAPVLLATFPREKAVFFPLPEEYDIFHKT